MTTITMARRTAVIAAASSLCLLLLLSSSSPDYYCAAFTTSTSTARSRNSVHSLHHYHQHSNTPVVVRMSVNNDDDDDDTGRDTPSSTRSIKAVTVLGGTGFVGSRVCQLLANQEGIDTVISLSQSGTIPAWCTAHKDETDPAAAAASKNQNKMVWTAIDLLTASEHELDTAMGTPDAVISCLGTIGTDPILLRQGNGLANVNGFESAQRCTTTTTGQNNGVVPAIAYVSVCTEVRDCQAAGWLPEFFTGYFEGKTLAEDAAKRCGQAVTIVAPTFIYGGDAFGLLPPRVNDAYGSFIDQLLSSPVFQFVADKTPPGLLKVAFRPPVAVEAVAGACVQGILKQPGATGTTTGLTLLDTAHAINALAQQPPATGMTEAKDWTVQTVLDTADWIQQKVKDYNEKQQ